MGNPVRQPKIEKLQTISEVAREVGVPKQTISSAVASGHIRAWRTKGGLPLLLLTDVFKWSKNRPTLGRPRQDTKRKAS